MQTFLMRQNIEERDYTKPIARFEELAAAVTASEAAAEEEAFNAILNGNSGSSATAAVKKETDAQKYSDAHLALAEHAIARSRKAFGYLHAAIPDDLRLQVKAIPQGYAYGLWSFLEQKFMSTEQDSVLMLWKEFTAMRQAEDETFDEYKAKVDSIKDLLEHAKQKVEPGLYASLLLWNLQPKYNTVVLTLKTSERLKDTNLINWEHIRKLIGDYERSHCALGETNLSSADRAMAARSSAPKGDNVGYQEVQRKMGKREGKSANTSVTCYRCDKTGHYAGDCKSTRHRDGTSLPKRQEQGGKRKWASKQGRASREPDNDGSDEDDKPRVNIARRHPASDSEESSTESDDDKDKTQGRTYLARVLAGLAQDESKQLASKVESVALTASSNQVPAAIRHTAGGSVPSEAQLKETDLDTLLRTKAKVIDTGATAHMTGNRAALHRLEPCAPMPIKLADSSIVTAKQKGVLNMRLPVHGDKKGQHVRVKLENVYYHERFDVTLLCWDDMRKKGWELHSTKKGTHVITPGGNKIKTSTKGKLTLLLDEAVQRVFAGIAAGERRLDAASLVAMHRRLGHLSWTQLMKLLKSNALVGSSTAMRLTDAEEALAKKQIQECTACAQGKTSCNATGNRGLDKGTRPGEVLHMDTFYLTQRDPTTSKKVTQYCLLATDGHTEWRWAYVSTRLHELPSEVVRIIRSCRAMTGEPVRLLITDLGSEFNNSVVERYCDDHGIKMQPAPPRVKELNGLAEKSVDTVKNHVRTMLQAAGITDGRECERAITHHIYLWNRTHIGRRTDVTPYEAITGRQADIAHVGEFGCDAFVAQHRSQRDTTFSTKAEPGIYLGHDSRLNCARVRLARSGKIVLSKDVRFREGSFTHLRTTLLGQGEEVLADEYIEPVTIHKQIPDTEEKSNEHAEPEREQYRYEVSRIVATRVQDGIKQYQVQWVGYPDPTWEPASTIKSDAPGVVKEYEERIAPAAITRMTRSVARLQAEASAAEVKTPDNDSVPSEAVGLAALEAAWRL